jgi:hypothetical protein
VDEHQVPLSKGRGVPGKVTLRPDKRPRPIVLRVAAGDCLTVNLTNLLAYQANPNKHGIEPERGEGEVEVEPKAASTSSPTSRSPTAMSASRSTACRRSTASPTSPPTPGATATSWSPRQHPQLHPVCAEREGAFAATSQGATFGGEGGAGNVANGLFGQVVVVPKVGAPTATPSPKKKCAWPPPAAPPPASR